MTPAADIALRAWQEKDVERLADMRNDRALQSLLLARVRGSDQSQVRQWLRDRTSNPDSLFYVVTTTSSDECIGYVQVVDIDWIDRRGNLGICLAPGEQGQGLGTKTLGLLVDSLRSDWDLRKLSLRVRSDNVRAIRCYERFGFLHCGLQRRHVRLDGAWLDVACMELLFNE
jgi:diamine N-acetyltransferase